MPAEQPVSENIEVVDWSCDYCGLVPLKIDSKRMYLIDDNGQSHPCLHPLEHLVVVKHLGPNPTERLLQERIVYREDCFCPSCFEISLLDPARDPLICLNCRSDKVRLGVEFADQKCPKCKRGYFRATASDMKFLDELIENLEKT